jgi:hypothetical protein
MHSQSLAKTCCKKGCSAMIEINKNPNMCSNTTFGLNDCHSHNSVIKYINTKPICKAKKAFHLLYGRVVHLCENTRLCEVATKLVEAGVSGVSVVDFPIGVRISALVHQLRGLGLSIPYQAHRAVYRLTQFN